MTTKTSKTIKTGTLYREFPIESVRADTDSREITLTFSTEYRVERWFGFEILDHSQDAVRMDRLRDAGPILVNHDRDKHVGVIVSADIDSKARRGRAVARFGNSALAEEIFRDIVDGIRTKTSVGYRVHRAVMEEVTDDAETIRAVDWEPIEISIATIPADPTSAIGRERENGRPSDGDTFETVIEGIRDMTTKDKETPTAPTKPVADPAPTVDARQIENDIREREVKRMKDLHDVGENFADHGGRDLAAEVIKEGGTVSDLQGRILERLNKKPVPSPDIGMSDREIERYSFVRVLNALSNPTSAKAQNAAGFEMELSRAAAEKATKEPQGVLVPADVLRSPLDGRAADQRRDLMVGSGGGGYTVATDVLGQSFIELLRNRAILLRAGATEINDLVGNVAIPRQSSGATAYWVAEGGAPSESNAGIDQVNLSPKTVGAFTDFSKQLLGQSSIDVEAFVRNDLARALGLEKDRVGLYGGGGNQPVGVSNTTGIGSVTITTPTWAQIVELETDVAAANADVGALSYLVNPVERGTLKTTPKVGTFPVFMWENDQVNGYPAFATNQIVAGDYWFGNWSDLVIANWAGLDLMVDPYTQSTNRLVRVLAFQDTDYGVRHPASFSLGQ